MNQKEFLILAKIHRNNTPISDKNLAEYFNVNIKTIRKYIDSITTHYENLLKYEDGECYINRKKSSELLNNFIIHVPETEEGRLKYVIYTISMQKNMKINLCDLSDLMFVSIPYLMSLITKLKRIVNIYNISIITKAGFVYILGDEFDIQHLLFDEIHDNYAKVQPSPTLLNLIFGDIDSYELFDICKNTYYEKNKLYDDYRCYDLTSKLCIIIVRIKHGFRITDFDDNSYDNIEDNSKFIQMLEKKYGLKFNVAEKKVINVWLSPTNFYYCVKSTNDEIIAFVKERVDILIEKYKFHLIDNQIYENISILIKNMIYRNTFYMNLVISRDTQIRHSIFSDACDELYAAIVSKYQIERDISEYLKLYNIMKECLEATDATGKMIKVGIVGLNTPTETITKFIDLVLYAYSDFVIPKQIWQNENEIQSGLVDVIISFQDLVKFYSIPILILNPFVMNENLVKLDNFINNYISGNADYSVA